MTGAIYADIIKQLKVHSTEEFGHAAVLADQISFLGGFPTVEVGEIKACSDNHEILEQNLAGEVEATRRYKLRIDQAESLKEYALAVQLCDILAMEQEHAMDLMQALGK